MSNLNTLPLQDGFRTSLSQSWDGATGTVYVATTPTFTFPSGVTTYIVVNAGKSNMQIAEISAYDATAKTLTVNDITLEKGASINSTAQTHAVGSEVIISDNYQFWKDIQTAINSKMNKDEDNELTAGQTTFTSTSEAQLIFQNVTTAQRNALTGITNGAIVYDTDEGVLYQYIGGAWATFASGTTPNASETVAGKVELATAAERAAGTSTGGSGGPLVVSNDALVKTSSGASDENKIAVLNSDGKVDAFVTQTSEKSVVTTVADSDLIAIGDDESITKENFFTDGIIAPKTLLATQDISSTTTLNVAHGLGRTPRFVRVYAIRNSGFQSVGTFDGTNNRATYPTGSSTFTNSTTYGVGIFDSASAGRLEGEISFDSTNVTFTWTKITSPTGTGYIQIEVI